jgi:hypothetical protein
VSKHFFTIFCSDESIAFFSIEPFYNSSHFFTSVT